jgi:hypothetical protein
LLLEYYSSTQVKLTCTNALPVVVVFPDLSTIEINSTGILGTVTGSIDTTYYIYIDKDGLCSASTTAPDVTYPNKKTLGDTKILVGYAAFSSTNTLSGDWNVCSYWNEPTREWVSPTIDSENFTFTKSGLIIPPSGQATVSRTGVTTITGTACGYSPTWDTFCTVSATISASLGSVNGNLPSSTTYGYYSNIAPYGPWPYVFDRNVQIPAGVDNVTVSINTGITLAEGVYNSIILTATKSVLSTATYCCADGFLQYANTSAGYHINSFTARSGNLYITRQGNIV